MVYIITKPRVASRVNKEMGGKVMFSLTEGKVMLDSRKGI